MDKTDHRQFIERKLAQIEADIEREGVVIEHEGYNGAITLKKHPLVDVYAQLIQALTKIDPSAVKRSDKLNLSEFLGDNNGKKK